MTHKDIIKLNLGSGPSGIGGWLNYDWGVLPILSKLPLIRKIFVIFGFIDNNYDISWPKIRLVNILYKLPLGSESVNYIYCSHVLEHFEKYQAINILNECYRVLKKGGVMRIVLPDLKKLVAQYNNAEEFNRKFFGYDKDKKSLFNYFIRGHRWMYDEKSIVGLLVNIFDKINIVSWQSGACPNIRALDLKSHKDHSLYIEVKK